MPRQRLSNDLVRSSRLSLQQVRSLPAWSAMSPLQKCQVETLLSPEMPIADRVSQALYNVSEPDAFMAAEPAKQVADIFAALSKSPLLLGNVPLILATLSLHLDTPVFSRGSSVPVADYAFHGTRASAVSTEYTVGPDAKRITVIEPASGSYSPPNNYDALALVGAAAQMPAATRALIDVIRLNPVVNPDNDHWSGAYRIVMHAHMSCDGEGVVTVYPTAESRPTKYLPANLSHEATHRWSESKWGHDDQTEAWAPWRAAAAADGLPVSEYGSASPREDFSESVALYSAIKGTPYFATFQKLYPHRFTFIAANFPGA